MLEVTTHFGLPDDRVWLNAAHQGPLPKRAAAAVEAMVRWKLRPHHLQSGDAFTDLPERLRSSLADLVAAPEAEIVLTNSASYGLHLIANGLQIGSGDEVIVAANDFPSDILPWLRLQGSGVTVKQLSAAHQVLTAEEVGEAITDRTQVVCLPWVHSFSGNVTDLDAIGHICREADALFVVNGSQGVGAIPIAVRNHPIDALISVGFKWLCGPYGTGFAWIGRRTEERLTATKLYWLNALSTDELEQPTIDYTALKPRKTGRHDIFGTANFFNFAGFVEAVDLLRDVDLDRIYAHDLSLAAQLVDGLDPERYHIMERGDGDRLSSILFVQPTRQTVEVTAARLSREGIDVAQRSGLIRLSPHLYNTQTDIDHALATLNK